MKIYHYYIPISQRALLACTSPPARSAGSPLFTSVHKTTYVLLPASSVSTMISTVLKCLRDRFGRRGRSRDSGEGSLSDTFRASRGSNGEAGSLGPLVLPSRNGGLFRAKVEAGT